MPNMNGSGEPNYQQLMMLLKHIAEGRESFKTIKCFKEINLFGFDPLSTDGPAALPIDVQNFLKENHYRLIQESLVCLKDSNSEANEGSLLLLALICRLPKKTLAPHMEVTLLGELWRCYGQSTKDKAVVQKALWCLWKAETFSDEAWLNELPNILDAMAVHCGSIETLSAQGSKNQISLMILNVLHRFTEKFRNKMATQTSKWFPLLCRLGLHQAVVVNEKALKLLEEMEENHQCCELSQAMRNEIKTSFSKRLMTLFDSKKQLHTLKYWNVLVKYLGTSLHEGASLLNAILPLVESGFREKTDQNIRAQAFVCWQSLIENFSLDPNVLCHKKRLDLILQPLKTASFAELCSEQKLITWWTLVVQLKSRLETHFEDVFLPMIKFCVGGDIEGVSSTEGNANLRFLAPAIVSGRAKLLFLDLQQSDNFAYTPIPSVQKYIGEIIMNIFCGSTENVVQYSILKRHLKRLQIAVLNFPVVWKTYLHLFLQCLRIWGVLAVESELETVYRWSSICWKTLWEHWGNSPFDDWSGLLENTVIQFSRFLDEVKMPEERKLELLAEFSVLKLKKDKCVDAKVSDEGSFALMIAERSLNSFVQLLIAKTVSNAVKQNVTKIWRNAMKSALMGHTPVYSYTVASKMLKHLTDITPTVQNAEQSELLSELWINHADLLSKLLQKVNVINEGISGEQNYNCLISALSFPMFHLSTESKNQGVKKMVEYWSSLYQEASRCCQLEMSSSENSFCEAFCSSLLLDATAQNWTILTVRSVSTFLRVVINQAVYTDNSAIGMGPQFEGHKEFETLGNLKSLVQLVTLLLKKYVENVHLLQGDEEEPLICVQLLFTSMKNSSRMAGLIKSMFPVLTTVLEKCNEKIFPKKLFKKIDGCWSAICTSVIENYSGPYDSGLLEICFPVLRSVLVHSRSQIQTEAFNFWRKTFSKSSWLSYSPDIKNFFLNLKQKSNINCPGLVEDIDRDYRNPPTLQSQPSSSSLDQTEAGLNIPVIDESPAKKIFDSFLNKEQALDTGVEESSPRVPPLKLTLDTVTPQVSGLKSEKKKETKRRKTRVSDVQDEEFVVIPASPKQKKMVLTEHQQEVFRQRKDMPFLNTGSLNSDSQPLPEMFMTESQLRTLSSPDNIFESLAMSDEKLMEGVKRNSTEDADQEERSNNSSEKPGESESPVTSLSKKTEATAVFESEDESFDEENKSSKAKEGKLSENLDVEESSRGIRSGVVKSTNWSEMRNRFQQNVDKQTGPKTDGSIIDLTTAVDSDSSLETPRKRKRQSAFGQSSRLEESLEKLKRGEIKRRDPNAVSPRHERLWKTSQLFRSYSPESARKAIAEKLLAKETRRRRGKSLDISAPEPFPTNPSAQLISNNNDKSNASHEESNRVSPSLTSYRRSASDPLSSTSTTNPPDGKPFALADIDSQDVNRIVDPVDLDQENDRPLAEELYSGKRRRRTVVGIEPSSSDGTATSELVSIGKKPRGRPRTRHLALETERKLVTPPRRSNLRNGSDACVQNRLVSSSLLRTNRGVGRSTQSTTSISSDLRISASEMENENHDQTQDKPLPQMPVEETPLEMQDANFPPLQTNTDSGISASSQRKDIEMTAEVQQLEPIKVLPVKDSSVEEVSSSFKEPMNINDSAAVLSPKKENNVEFRADDAENADEKPSDSFSGKNSTDEVSTIISSNADEWEKTTDLMVEDNQLELYVPPIPSLDEFSDVHKPKEQRRESPVASGNSSMPEFLVQTPSASSSLPNLCASPSGSILKRPKVVDDSNSGESPSSKRRRVSFAPLKEETDECSGSSEHKSPAKRERVKRTRSSLSQKFSLIPGGSSPLLSSGISQMASPRTQSMVKTIQERQKAKKAEVPTAGDVGECIAVASSAPYYPDLISCTKRLDQQMIWDLTESDDDSVMLAFSSRNLTTVGDLSALSADDIFCLPISEPKLVTLSRVLDSFKKSLSVATVEQSEEQLEINPSDETTAVLKLQADEIVTPLDSVLYADVTPVEIDSAPLLISETLAESVSIEQEMSGMDESLTNASFFDANFLSSVAVEQCRDLSNDNVGPEPERFSSNSSVADETWLTAEGAEQVDTEKLMAELCSLGRIADPEDSEENECQSHGRKSAEISIEPSLKNFGHSQVDTHFSPAPYCPAVDDLSPFADETIQTTEKHETLSETENLDESQSIVQPTNANPINDTGSTDISFEQKIKEFEFAEISLKLVELCGLVDEPTLSNLSSAQLCEILIQFNRCSETILEVLKKKSA